MKEQYRAAITRARVSQKLLHIKLSLSFFYDINSTYVILKHCKCKFIPTKKKKKKKKTVAETEILILTLNKLVEIVFF